MKSLADLWQDYQENKTGAAELIKRAAEVEASPIYKRIVSDIEFQVAQSDLCRIAYGDVPSSEEMLRVAAICRAIVALTIARLES